MALLFVLGCAGQARTAPSFTVHTLEGGSFSSNSLRGRITLLQFWATWCPYCRRDEAAVDEIERMFAGQGLSVIAINEGESEAEVRSYLRQHPRACQVALDEHKDVPRRFGAHGYPSYVLVDGAGRIVGQQSGSGGKESLLALLRQAGLSLRNDTEPSIDPGFADSPGGSGPKVYELPGVRTHRHGGARENAAGASKPLPKTVFILVSGERVESDRYTMDSRALHVTVGAKQRTIALSQVNRDATAEANRKRGLEVKFPVRDSEVFVAF